MFERRLYFHVDWLLLAAVLLLAAIGLTMIYSTTYRLLPDGSGYAGREFWTQLYALGLGFVALLVCLTIDYRALAEHSLLIYGILLGLLVFVLVGGDIHRSRMIRHPNPHEGGYPLTEFITSPLHEDIIQAANVPHPGLVFDSGAIGAFLLIDCTDDLLRASFHSAPSGVRHRVEIPAAELR